MTYVKNIANVTNMDRERWTTKFDCNCKVCVFLKVNLHTDFLYSVKLYISIKVL